MMYERWTGWGRVHWDGVWLDPLLMLLLLAAFAIGVVTLVRRLRSGARGRELPPGPAARGDTDVDKRHKGVQA
jgi:hypothetical protein